MRRILIMMFILFLSAGCVVFTIPLFQSPPTPTATSLPPTKTIVTRTPAATVPFTPTPTQPVPTTTTTAQATPLPVSQTFEVLFHPDDVLYVGDQVSFEVISPPGLDLKDASLQVQVDPPAGPEITPVNFAAWGIQNRQEATLIWAWDTQNETAGIHTLAFSILPQGYAWTEQVTLLPSSDVPPSQADAEWASTQTQCCTVFYITNTSAERDLAILAEQIDVQARLSIDEMDATFSEPITVTVLPRLLGHGGFTSDEISVSYLDRNYAANSWEMVVHHEMIHVIDAHLEGDFRPTIFVEGLAVYLAGGHYKEEPLMPRAATLLEGKLGLYIPLKQLADDFYASQHEIGYLEGGSLIEYLVNTFGWEAFSAFYRDIHINEGETHSQAIDTALRAHFSISFDELEKDFVTALTNEAETSAWMDDVRLSVAYYDTLRRYQEMLDRSAYFRTAWLLDNKAMRERGIVADYLRHPQSPENVAIETLLIRASRQISEQQYADASNTLEQINLVLSAFQEGVETPFNKFPIAADHYAITTLLQGRGYEVQSIQVAGDSATASVTNEATPDLIILHLTSAGGDWSLPP